MKKHGIFAALAGVAMVGTLFAADRTTPLPVVSAFTDTSKKNLEFAENATIKVRRGLRGGKVIAWTEETIPPTYDTLRFVRDPSATPEQVLDEWAGRRWPKCREEMKRLSLPGFVN